MTRDELELLTIAEVAGLWRVSKRTVQRRIAAGEIPTVPFGGHRRIRAVDAARIAEVGTCGYRGGSTTTIERTAR